MRRKLLMIPGPIEVDEQVLMTNGKPVDSHVSPVFIETYGACLDGLKTVFAAEDGMPFVIAGSGTYAMELAVANVVEPEDRCIVLETGYFSWRMADILLRHGGVVDLVKAEVGMVPDLDDVETALKSGAKILAITHVDTSTGVVAPVKEYAALGRKYNALVIVDGVCAVAGQEFRQKDWDVDICLTGSQKALAAPPGLALVMARPRALKAFEGRKTPVGSYYADWNLWLPIMRAYMDRKPSYFATPAVNLVDSLAVSVQQILEEGMDARWKRHRKVSKAFKAGSTALGLNQIPVEEAHRADTLTTLYYPEGVDAALLGRIGKAGVALAGGLYPELKTQYFRVGHMGNNGIQEILTTLSAIESGLGIQDGSGVAAAQAEWVKNND
ncbi:MAG: alanine--glyoxylate aminotransferase family protein [Anaerolineaceae bacterium]|nr:alanine--glyoxylate aminotransferase family protein [Anaerolineaceae bacterium]